MAGAPGADLRERLCLQRGAYRAHRARLARRAPPSGKDVFGDGTPAHRLPQYISIPSYLVLLAGTGWSAWKMRGAPELRDRFLGTLGIAVGASVVAGAATFAAWGRLELFSVSLLAGICIMFWGFLRASRKSAPAATGSSPTSG